MWSIREKPKTVLVTRKLASEFATMEAADAGPPTGRKG